MVAGPPGDLATAFAAFGGEAVAPPLDGEGAGAAVTKGLSRDFIIRACKTAPMYCKKLSRDTFDCSIRMLRNLQFGQVSLLL